MTIWQIYHVYLPVAIAGAGVLGCAVFAIIVTWHVLKVGEYITPKFHIKRSSKPIQFWLLIALLYLPLVTSILLFPFFLEVTEQRLRERRVETRANEFVRSVPAPSLQRQCPLAGRRNFAENTGNQQMFKAGVGQNLPITERRSRQQLLPKPPITQRKVTLAEVPQ